MLKKDVAGFIFEYAPAIRSMRPEQWTKNFFVFAPLIFAKKIFEPALLMKTAGAFVVFCILSGALYIFNDLRDAETDRLHPKKAGRPIASGKLNKGGAMTLILLFSLTGLPLAFMLHKNYFVVVVAYCLLQMAYSLGLKHLVILDMFIIAAGFVFRVIAGGLVIEVPLSSWLLICTVLLALFLAMGKRRHELVSLEHTASQHRPILKEYSPYLLDQMMAVVTASTLIAYCLYTVSEETSAKLGTTNLVFTVPFVLYGIFRYLYLIHHQGKGGNPEELIIRDKPLLLDIFLWIFSVIIILYRK